MSIIKVTRADLRDPLASEETLVRIEDAGDCEGYVCQTALSDSEGNLCEPGPHHHMVVSGIDPAASARCIAIFSK